MAGTDPRFQLPIGWIVLAIVQHQLSLAINDRYRVVNVLPFSLDQRNDQGHIELAGDLRDLRNMRSQFRSGGNSLVEATAAARTDLRKADKIRLVSHHLGHHLPDWRQIDA